MLLTFNGASMVYGLMRVCFGLCMYGNGMKSEKKRVALVVDGVARGLFWVLCLFVVISISLYLYICYTIFIYVNICRYETILVFYKWLKLP